MTDFTDEVQQASFRDIPFAVRTAESAHGRDGVLHSYPFKDKGWREDLGRGTRDFSIVGFLITDSAIYGGGDVFDQYQQLVGAVETLGSGTLVHPILGELTVSVPKGGLRIIAQWDKGRVFEFTLSCIETGDRDFPSNDQNTQEDTDDSADDADQGASNDFFSDVTNALKEGASVIDMAVNTASSWIDLVQGGVADATNLFNSLISLPAAVGFDFGRYFEGRTVGFFAAAPVLNPNTTIGTLIAAGLSNAAAVDTACNSLLVAAASNMPANTAAAAQAVAVALLAATQNPADAVRILSDVANFFPAVPTSGSVTGMAESTMQVAMGALCRRAAFTALARATALYQPSSADDAANLRTTVSNLLQGEIDIAGDYPDDNTFLAFTILRASVVNDLNMRGAGKPALITVQASQPLPACVLAQRLYQDASRTDELVLEADPPHPAFMPTNFKALAQ